MKKKESASIKATEILKFAKENHIEISVINDEDLKAAIDSASVRFNRTTHECIVKVQYTPPVAATEENFYCGDYAFSILGIDFSTSRSEPGSDFSWPYDAIDFDGVDIFDFMDQLVEILNLKAYEPNNETYEFDENNVTDDALIDAMCEQADNYDIEYAVDANGTIYGFKEVKNDFASADNIPSNLKHIDAKEAFKQLAKNRQNMSFISTR